RPLPCPHNPPRPLPPSRGEAASSKGHNSRIPGSRGRHPVADRPLPDPGRPKRRSTLAGVRQLPRYHSPGNVREQLLVLERAVITADGARLAIELSAG